MSAVISGYEHITFNASEGVDQNAPIIKGTTMKVVELVLEQLAYGWSAEELRFQHPHLSLGQIYSALAYYWDHQATLDTDIERRLRRVDEIRNATMPLVPPLVERLRTQRLI